jgi:hypothetical protein
MERCIPQATRVLLPALLAVAALVSAAAAVEFDPQTMMPVSEVQRGMKGIGKSVFQGTTIDMFDVEILGVLKAMDLGGDVILARITSGVPVERGTGAIEGMSGSPIYIDGRLVGALALGWMFPKEPIFGITPIQQMLESFGGQTPSSEATQAAAPGAVLHEREITRAAVAGPGHSTGTPFADERTIVLQPLGTLLCCSGFTSAGLSQASRLYGQRGLSVAPGGGPVPGVDTELEPGAALGVQLMTGDFDMTAVGTLTHREGDAVVAFGHPLMQLGETDLPLTTAYVHDVVPSLMSSMKMASPLVIHGRLLQDRCWSVGGTLGAPPEMVPVTVRVRDGDRGVDKVYRVQVAQNEELTPDLAMMAIINALTAAYKPFGEGTARTSFRIQTKEGHRISRSNMAYDAMAGPFAAIREFTDALGLVAFNTYQKVHLSSVEFETEVSSRNTRAEIKRVYADKPVLEPGDQTNLHVFLKPFDGELVEKTVTLRIPRDVTGMIRVLVTGGDFFRYLGGRMGVLTPVPETLDQEIAEFERTERGDALVVSAALPDIGIGVGGRKLERLPSSIASVMAFSQSSDMTIGRGELREVVPTEYVVGGMAMVMLTVYEKGTKPPSPGMPPGPPGMGPPGPGEPAAAVPPEGEEDIAGWGWARAATSLADFTWDWSRRRWSVARGARAAVPLPPDLPPRLRRMAERASARSNAAPEEDSANDGKEEQKEDEGEPTAVARQPSTWTQDTGKDFLAGRLGNMAVVGKGTLTLAPLVRRLHATREYYLWSLAADGDGILYAGTGTGGQILKIMPGGETTVFAETGEVSVSCLALGPDGALYAGTAPEGKILRVSADGTAAVLCDTPEAYVWALAFDAAGRLYAATGSRGIVYRFTPGEPGGTYGEPEVVCDLEAPHALSLVISGDTAFVGTAEEGVIYRVREGKAEALYDSDEETCINALAVDDVGDVYAGTSPGGRIVKIAPSGAAKVLYEGQQEQVLCMWRAADGRIYAGTGNEGLLLRIEEDDEVSTLWDADEGQILALTGGPKGTLYAATGNVGVAYLVDPAGVPEGSFVSAVCDAGRLAQWGTLSWRGTVPDGAEMAVQVRSGNTADPDSTWSDWSAPRSRAAGDTCGVPPGRFLQYRVQMKRGTAATSPTLDLLRVVYLPANQKPTLTLSKPADGGTIGKKCKFEWTAEDADKDTLRVSILRSGDGGETWETVKEGIEESSYEWDVSDLQEGTYTLKVVVSDEVSNPGRAETAEVILRGMVVDTTPPTVLLSGKPSVSADGRVTVRGFAMDSGSAVSTVQYRVDDDKSARAAAPGDGIFDSAWETFEFTTDPLEQGERKVHVDVRDAAGNLQTRTQSVLVETGKPKAEVKEEESAGEEKPAEERKPREPSQETPEAPPDGAEAPETAASPAARG